MNTAPMVTHNISTLDKSPSWAFINVHKNTLEQRLVLFLKVENSLVEYDFWAYIDEVNDIGLCLS